MEKRGRFDSCMTFLTSAEAAERQARIADEDKNKMLSQLKWQETLQQTNNAISASVCDGLYLKRLQNLQVVSKRRLDKQQ